MKKIIYILLLLILPLCSCVREELRPETDDEDRQSVTLSLRCLLSDRSDKIVTKAFTEDCIEMEKKVNDLLIYVFEVPSGALIGFHRFSSADLGSETEENDGYSWNISDIKTLTGKAVVYAVANPNTNKYFVETDLKTGQTQSDYDLLTNIDPNKPSDSHLTRSLLDELTFRRTPGSVDILDGRMMFSGYLNGGHTVQIRRVAGQGNTAEVVNEDGTELTGENAEIRLTSIVSKNIITIMGDDFTPQYFELKGIPLTGALMPQATRHFSREADGGGYEYIRTQVLSSEKKPLYRKDGLYTTDPTGAQALYLENGVVSTTGTNPLMGLQFTIYLPQNLAGPLTQDDIDAIPQASRLKKWSDREKNHYEADGTKVYENAPEDCSFMGIYGVYSGAHGGDYGNVKYTVHLGDFDPTHGGNLQNFAVRREDCYHYNITVKSVDDIAVEAMRKDSQYFNHGTEGVIISPHAVNPIQLDCHYEARALSFDLGEVYQQITEEGGYILKINTYFDESKALLVRDENGVCNVYDAAAWKQENMNNQSHTPLTTIGADGTPANLSAIISGKNGTAPIGDYDWVHIIENSSSVATSATSKATTDGKGYRIDSSHAIADVCKYPGDGHSALKNIFQFLRQLYIDAMDNGQTSTTKYYTFFFDENYYPEMTWDKYTNKMDKRYLFLANHYDESTDLRSVYARALYVFEQDCIWTFYDPNETSLKAYGKEVYNEDKNQNNGQGFLTADYDITTTRENWNGYTAATRYYQNKTFTTGNLSGNTTKGSGSQQYTIHSQDIYNKVSTACMSRNRDANGNGTLDAAEIRWYVPTIEQMEGFFIGDDLYVGEAKSFDVANLKNMTSGGAAQAPYHYFAASDKDIFWAEEGCSTGKRGNDWQQARKVRCTRTLESGTPNGPKVGTSDPDKYFTTETSTANEKTFTDITVHVDPRALRAYQRSSMSPSFEREVPNRAYSKFRVDSENLKDADGNTIDKVRSDYAELNKCTADQDLCHTNYASGAPDGASPNNWRVPNLRELSIMSSVLGLTGLGISDDGSVWSNTDFLGRQDFTGDATYGTFRYYDAANTAKRGYVFIYDDSGGRITIEPSTSHGYIRCVRDLPE